MQRLKDKIAIVTGAGRGIGAATARRFVQEGAKVVFADLSQEGLERATAGLDSSLVAICPTDVSDWSEIERCTQLAIERFGGLDIMVANAGIEGNVAPLVEYPVGEFERVLAVNLTGTFLSIRSAAPLIAKRGGGAILVTSSVAGIVGAAGLCAYVASKHAVVGLVKSAAIELAPLGIRVVSINPGPIDNDMMRHIEEKSAPGAGDRVKRAFEEKIPLGRYGENDEVASLAVFLASNEAGYCTGSTFVLDGGYTAQ